jgi:Icc-related predicted phosphoesterase
LRIVCVSDTHLFHEHPRYKNQIVIPDGDILIHAGDGTMRGRPREVMLWMAWLKSLPHPNKVVVAGNHDWLFQKNPTFARSMIPDGIIYLEDDMKEVAGLKIYGSPWTPYFLDWAFNLKRGHRLREKWNKIPRDIDILVTHGPPMGILDQVPDGERVGCEDLMDIVERVKPKLHVFGHIHHSGPNILKTSSTTFVNAAVLTEPDDEGYKPNMGSIVVVDL